MKMIDVAEYLMKFFAELERLLPNLGTRHMISTADGRLEIRIGAGDWYRISKGVIDNPDPIEAAHWWRTRHRIGNSTPGNKQTSTDQNPRVLGGGLDRKRAAASLAATEPVSCLVA